MASATLAKTSGNLH